LEHPNKTLLGSQDFWEVVQQGFEELENTTGYLVAQKKMLKETRSKDKATLYMLYRVVDEAIFEKIVGASTLKEAWDIFGKVFKGAVRAKQMRLQNLRCELEAMKMKDLEDVYSYISVANKLKRNGKTFTFTDARVVEKILQSLTDDFENVVCAIESQET